MTEAAPPSTVRTLVSALWFPAFFICGFMLCYLLPMHAPKPHDMPVVIVGDQAAHQLAASFQASAPGSFDITAVPDEAGAREAITRREAVAGYDPGTGALLYAKANGSALMMVLQQVFTPVAAATGHQLALTDLAPSAPGDVMGTGLLYCLLAMNIPPYVTVMMLLRAELRTRQKLAALVGVGAFASVVCYLAALSMGVIYQQPLLLLVGFLLTQAVGWTSFGLVPLVKQFLPGVAMGLFVLLSMPSSGGALPKELVPPFFQALHGVLPLGQAVDAMRGLLYFGGVGAPRAIIGLCCWCVLGTALVFGHRWWVLRRAGSGATPVSAGTYEHEDDSGVVLDPALEAPKPRKHRTLSGSVHDPGGTPVPGAILTITDQSGLQLARLVTSTAGEYEVHDLPEGFATVVVSAPGRRPSVDRVPIRSGRPGHQDFTLRSEREVAAGR